MSISLLSTNGLSQTQGSRVSSSPITWTRPADWLTLPTVSVGDRILVGLFAIFPNDPNYVTVQFTGAYTVDWGDGVVENYASATQGAHSYDYTTIPSSTLSTATGVSYRQVIITVTPQAGQTWVTVGLNGRHPAHVTNVFNAAWLDVKVAGATITGLAISYVQQNMKWLQQFEFVGPSSMINANQAFLNCASLQSVIGTQWTATATNLGNMFQGCTLLRTVPLLDTRNVTVATGMFQGCSSLRDVPKFDLSKVTSLTTMFQGCSSLTSVPAYDLSSATSYASMFQSCTALTSVGQLKTNPAATVFTSMFQGCSALTSVPLFNTGAGINFTSMFSGCTSLTTVPLFDTKAATTLTSMFNGCTALRSVPLLNTANCTTFATMFSACSSLVSVPLFNTIKATSMSSMFANCFLLTTVPAFDMSKVTNAATMFQGCISLLTVPLMTTSAVTVCSSMFSGCTSLQALPALDMSAATTGNTAGFVNNCYSLASAPVKFSVGVSFVNTKMSGAALDAMYTALASGVTAQTVTVTGNWGVATDTPTIATAKGWTVTGS